MNDLISRQAAIDYIDAVFPVDPTKSDFAQGIACGAALAKTYIKQLPSAQPERKTGRWIQFPNHYAYKCSECGRLIETTDGKNNVCKHYPYCHCGAKMELPKPWKEESND